MSDVHAAKAPADNAAPAPEPKTEQSAEAEAREMGWQGPENFKGDPALFVDAETFVKRGKEFIPFLKASNRELKKELEASNKRIAETEKTLRQFGEHHAKTEQRAYERALVDLKAKHAEAVGLGDVETAQGLTDQIVELNAEVKAAPKPPSPGEDPEFVAWQADNKWFGTDKIMTGAAREIAEDLARVGVTKTKQLAEVAKQIREAFPDKFENPRRKEAPATGAPTPTRQTNGKSYSDLPADAKAMCDDFVRQKVLTREQYVKDYFS